MDIKKSPRIVAGYLCLKELKEPCLIVNTHEILVNTHEILVNAKCLFFKGSFVIVLCQENCSLNCTQVHFVLMKP